MHVVLVFISRSIAHVLNVIIYVVGIPAFLVVILAKRPFERHIVRSQEQQDLLIRRARDLFAEIAERHGLELQWDDAAPVEAACTLPKQSGLDFKLWLNLQNNDEIGVQTDLFTASWFPFDDPSQEAAFLAAVDGLIAGTVRQVCSCGPRAARPHRVKLQSWSGGEWKTIHNYGLGFFGGWPVETRIVTNRPRAAPSEAST